MMKDSAPILGDTVWFDEDSLFVRLVDGQTVSAPLEWFPLLRSASIEQRANWRLIARGIGIHWPDVEEDIAVTTLLRGW